MKKIFTLIAGLMLVCGSLLAQEENLKKSYESWNLGRGSITRITMEIPSNITTVKLDGECRLLWVPDTANYVECYFIATGNNAGPEEPAWSGSVLTCSNPYRTIYLLHTTHSGDIAFESIGSKAKAFSLKNADGMNSFSDVMATMAEASSAADTPMMMKIMFNQLFKTDNIELVIESIMRGAGIAKTTNQSHVAVDGIEELDLPAGFATIGEGNGSSRKDGRSDRKSASSYDKGDRTNFDFHWGFNNWGTSPVNGLVGMSDPGYDLRTSFSSYQLSYNYRLLMTNHFELSMGLGYESDVYKFNKPYVDYSDKAFQAIDTTGANGYFSTRFVTRYVQLPIGVAYRVNNNFLLKLSAIPALGWCGKHTGLKHEVHQSGSNPQDQVNLKETLNPYKLDVRLDMSFGGIGLFLQVATLPVFVEGTKIYPIKIGFMI